MRARANWKVGLEPPRAGLEFGVYGKARPPPNRANPGRPGRARRDRDG